MNLLFRSLIITGTILFSSITSWGQVAADFYFELSNGPGNMTAPIKVDFVNASAGQALAYSWTIDGVAFSAEEESSRLFLKGGKYEICLEVNSDQIKNRQCQQLEFFDPPALPALAQSSKR